MRALLLLLCGCATKNIDTENEPTSDRVEIEILEEELENLPEACDPDACEHNDEDSP